MNITKTAAAILGGLILTTSAPVAAFAQGTPAAASAAALDGKPVRGQGGVLLGHVERVIRRADGTPAQVLVRPKGPPTAGPRSLAIGALTVEGDGLVAPLSLAEFNAMHAVAVN